MHRRTQYGYPKWLEQFQGRPFYTHSGYIDAGGPDDSPVIIRHDIDNDIQQSLAMARIEHGLGVVSTYAVLHTAPYYHERNDLARPREERLLKAAVDEFQSLGHEVVIHNDALSECVLTGKNYVAVLEDELAFLRSLGAPGRGTAAHGNALCRRDTFINWEIFSDFCRKPREVGGFMIPGPPMAHYGLEYEANPFPCSDRWSDSGGEMKRPGPCSANPGYEKFGGGTITYALIHPQWWEL